MRRSLPSYVLSLVLPLSLLIVGAHAQTVRVVDAANGAGTDFTSLQAAIDAAVDGDLLLVRSGSYAGIGGPFFPGPVTVSNKALTIQADTSALVILSQGLTISNLGADRSVFVRGVSLTCDKPLLVTGCAGPVWLEEVVVTGSCSGVTSMTAATILSSQQVFLNRCTVRGGGGPLPFAATTSNALLMANSSVHAYDSVILGGTSNSISPSSYGVRMQGGFLMASGCTIEGGGTNGGVPCGGPGLWLASGSPTVWLRDDTIVGGQGGCSIAPIQVDAGSVSTMGTGARSFDASSPVRAGGNSDVTFDGEAGDVLLLMLSLEPGAFFKVGLGGTLQLGFPLLTTVVFGPLPNGDPFTISAPTGPLPVGIEGVTVYVQAGYWLSPGQIVLSGGSAQLFLDGTF